MRELKLPVLLMGFGLPDDNLHAPNEKFHLANFHRGIESIVRFLEHGPCMRNKGSFAAYVLAGGRSTRMGQDKALLHLADKTLIEHAVSKLTQLTPDVYILGSRTELSPFAPLVPDLHEGCGPLGGMEAALAHSFLDWALLVPVDMPFLPVTLLRAWVTAVLHQAGARLSFFIVDDVPQPRALPGTQEGPALSLNCAPSETIQARSRSRRSRPRPRTLRRPSTGTSPRPL